MIYYKFLSISSNKIFKVINLATLKFYNKNHNLLINYIFNSFNNKLWF